MERITFDPSRAERYRKRSEIMAFRSDSAITYHKSWGTQELPKEAWVAVALDAKGEPSGDVYGIDEGVFEKTYRRASPHPHRYTKKTPVLAYQPGVDFVVQTKVEGRVETKEGRGVPTSWLVQNPGGEIYVVSHEEFRRTYVLEGALPGLPLCIYVVHHPASAEGRALARALHDWFRLKEDEGDGTEAGLPVWFRSCTDGPGEALIPEIRWDEAERNVVTVLVDDHMVADAEWRTALRRLCKEADQGPYRKIFPVPVDASAYRLGFLFARRNRLSADPPKPRESPMSGGATSGEVPRSTGESARESAIRDRARVLRRGLTEAVIRELRRGPHDELPEPIQVFLSHAKADGTEIAEAIRDGLASFGQLEVWYDAHDLAPGYPWAEPMRDAVARGTAALISVTTDAYPTRPWCRQEVILARTPTALPLDLDESGQRVVAFTVQPSVAVAEAKTRWSRPMAQLAQVPRLGWVEPRSGERERRTEALKRIEDIVDRLLLETLLVTFYRRLAPIVARRWTPEGSEDPTLVLLTWIPDPWSLAMVVKALSTEEAAARLPKPWVIAYPGHGLRVAERDELEDVLATMAPPDPNGERSKLISQERLAQTGASLPHPLVVALSAGGGDADVEAAGLGLVHVDDLMMRLSRRLLEGGATLVYGGILARHDVDLTRGLIEVVQGWQATAPRPRTASPHLERPGSGPAGGPSDAAKIEDDTDEAGPPLVNYVAWPHHRDIQLRDRANLTGICTFIPVDPPGAGALPDTIASDDPEHLRLAADAVSEMRRRACRHEPTTLRLRGASDGAPTPASRRAHVVVAGRIAGWSGWLPGILEEVVFALEAGQLPLVVGGFGGCAAILAGFLREPGRPWPEVLTFAHARAHNRRFRRLISSPGAERKAANLFRKAQETVQAYRGALHASTAAWPYGRNREEALKLLSASRPAHVIELVTAALAGIGDGPEASAPGSGSA